MPSLAATRATLKILDKLRKEKAKAESSWEMLNVKKSPYGYGYNYGKFGGYQEE
jgi:hypothetical protein